jgi:tripartite-type tricarboxylate transporter receptor subunit TctC
MLMNLRSLFAAGCAAVWLALAPAAADAQNFPVKPIHIIVPYVPGGTTDVLARLVGQELTKQWGKPVIVENRAGGNGMIGADFVAKAKPDGYTLGIASPGTHAANAFLYPDVRYDTINDFTPVTLAVSAPMILVVNPTLNVNTVQELIALAKSEPGKIAYASGGSGSSQHLAMAQFEKMADIKMTHVPYKGSANSYVDLIGGQVMAEFDVLPTALPPAKAGKLKAVAVASAKRLPELPDVPTVAESGVPGYEASSWYGFVAPAKLPPDILAKLHDGIVKGLNDPDVRSKLTTAGVIVVGGTPEEFAAHIKSEMAKAEQLIKAANIKPD